MMKTYRSFSALTTCTFCIVIAYIILPDVAQAANPIKLEKKCRRGDAELCWPAGLAYQDGKDVARDINKAAELFALGCEGGHHDSCVQLYRIGKSYREGDGI